MLLPAELYFTEPTRSEPIWTHSPSGSAFIALSFWRARPLFFLANGVYL